MTANKKLSVAFSALAVVLLATGVTAFLLIGKSEPLLSKSVLMNQNLSHVTQAIHALREHPEQVPQSAAWIDDLSKLWTESTAERKLLTEARALLVQDQNATRAVAKLDQLQRQYQAGAVDAVQQLVAMREVAVMATIAAMAMSVVLLVFLMFLARTWLVDPLRDLHAACLEAAAGQSNSTLGQNLPPEFADAGKALQQLVAEQRAAQERANHVERLASVGEACSHVTNSVRQALHSISTVAKYEGEAAKVDPNAKAAFQYIVGTINKLEAWVRNLHLVVGPHGLQTAPQAVEPVLRDVLSLLQPNLRDHAVEMTLVPGESLPDVRLDRSRFEQALLAVLGNAIEASPPGGCVTIRTRNAADKQAIIEIEDQGAGMSDVTRERAFTPFFTTKRENVGLGLTMARNVVRQHGGQIALTRGATGGTCVSIELPAA